VRSLSPQTCDLNFGALSCMSAQLGKGPGKSALAEGVRQSPTRVAITGPVGSRKMWKRSYCPCPKPYSKLTEGDARPLDASASGQPGHRPSRVDGPAARRPHRSVPVALSLCLGKDKVLLHVPWLKLGASSK